MDGCAHDQARSIAPTWRFVSAIADRDQSANSHRTCQDARSARAVRPHVLLHQRGVLSAGTGFNALVVREGSIATHNRRERGMNFLRKAAMLLVTVVGMLTMVLAASPAASANDQWPRTVGSTSTRQNSAQSCFQLRSAVANMSTRNQPLLAARKVGSLTGVGKLYTICAWSDKGQSVTGPCTALPTRWDIVEDPDSGARGYVPDANMCVP